MYNVNNMCSTKIIQFYKCYTYATYVNTHDIIIKCGQAWENWSYLYIKFDLILRVWNVITFYLQSVLYVKCHCLCRNPWGIQWNNRYWIPHTEQEVQAVGATIQTSVICVDKTCFSRPGHKHNYSYVYKRIHLPLL